MTEKALIGTWDVAFNQYRWRYTFAEGGGVTWRDVGNGRTGTGTWKNTGTAIAITWDKSTTRETWNLPITPAGQSGQVTADYASGALTATKDQARFDGFAPEGQQDAFACWAACLAWYTKVAPDIATISQQGIISASDPSTWAANGSISINGLMTLPLQGVYLQRSRIGQGDLPANLRSRKMPVLIGFSAGPLGGHVNVIHNYDEAAGTVGVMEPWYPDPSANKAYEFDGVVFFNKKTGQPFKFTGTMTRRPLDYYTSKPLEGQFVVASRA